MIIKKHEYIKEEVKDGFLVTEARKKLWYTELCIMEEFQKVCCKYNLHYFLLGGAAIGAERHKGFIPWDDDLDIGMLRNDFEVLVKVAKEELPSEYYVQYGICEEDMFSPLLRIRDGRTTGITIADRNSKANQGIFIEIYPFDNVSDNKLLRKIHLYQSKVLSNVIHARYYNLKLSKISKLANCIFSHKSNQELFDLWNKICQKNNKKKTKQVDTVMLPVYALQGIHLFTTAGCSTKKVQYEFLEVEIAVENDSFLRQQYGNYMQLPPLSQRGTHHNNTVFYDPDHPYSFWIGNPELDNKFE